jgi:DNA-directed RNA polymerase subunit RPC12/RpoP
LEKCKNCGRQFNSMRDMTYSAYGYCSWECLMNSRTNRGNQSSNNHNRTNKRGQSRHNVGSRYR